MAVSYDPDQLYDPNYTFGVICSEFLQEFGEKSNNIITRICHQRGLAIGSKFAARLEIRSFENAVNAFVAASEKSSAPAKLVFLEKGKAEIHGTFCPMGLNGRGRMICEMMMNVDRGILEEASGEQIRFTVNKTIAEGDDHCEVIFEIV